MKPKLFNQDGRQHLSDDEYLFGTPLDKQKMRTLQRDGVDVFKALYPHPTEDPISRAIRAEVFGNQLQREFLIGGTALAKVVDLQSGVTTAQLSVTGDESAFGHRIA